MLHSPSNTKSQIPNSLCSGQLNSTAPCLPQGSKAVLCVLPQQERCACFNSKANRLAVLDKSESKCLQIEWQRSDWCCELALRRCATSSVSAGKTFSSCLRHSPLLHVYLPHPKRGKIKTDMQKGWGKENCRIVPSLILIIDADSLSNL